MRGKGNVKKEKEIARREEKTTSRAS